MIVFLHNSNSRKSWEINEGDLFEDVIGIPISELYFHGEPLIARAEKIHQEAIIFHMPHIKGGMISSTPIPTSTLDWLFEKINTAVKIGRVILNILEIASEIHSLMKTKGWSLDTAKEAAELIMKRL